MRKCLGVLATTLMVVGCSKTDDGPDAGVVGEDVAFSDDAGAAEMGTVPLDQGGSDDAAQEENTNPGTADAADLSTQPDVGVGGTSIGTVWNTYYWLALEEEHPGPKTVELLDQACEPVGTVSEDYADALCIEGSGRLDDGTVVNYASLCDCGRPCSSGNIICWSALDANDFPWGQGAFGNALVPLRSLAVDRDVIALRTVVYIEEFDGLEIPSLGGVEGFTHDGCFRADDVGGAIEDDHIDIMAGSTELWKHMETVYPTRSTLNAFTGVRKCQYLEL